jgi:sugar phosphate isomerase/epimerase
MKIGATAAYTYAFKGTQMGLDDYLKSIATLPKLGVKCFDLEILEDQHAAIYADSANITALKSACHEHGVEIVGFTAWACVKYMHSLDPDMHAKGFALFKEICAVSTQFNCAYIHMGSDMIAEFIVKRDPTYASAPPVKISIPTGINFNQVLDDYAARLNKLAGIAADHGLKFSIEPRANALISGADSFLDIHRRAGHDNIYCCLDVIHSAFHRENLPIAIEKLGGKLLVFQFCDSISGDLTHYPLGEGNIDLTEILTALQKNNFQGFLMLELYKGGNDSKADVDIQYREACEFINRELGQ